MEISLQFDLFFAILELLPAMIGFLHQAKRMLELGPGVDKPFISDAQEMSSPLAFVRNVKNFLSIICLMEVMAKDSCDLRFI